MTGLILTRFAGYLRVDFNHRNQWGLVNIDFNVFGDTLTTSSCDDAFNILGHEVTVAPDATLRCWNSSGGSYFFRSMVRWLEAVLCEVQECAFMWDGEGPEGELRWFNGHENGGQLVLKWSGGRSSEPFEQQVALDKRQMVEALYGGFRGFVESDRYDPMSYEDLSHGQVWELVVAQGRSAFVREVAKHDRESAYALLDAVGRFAHDTEKGPGRQTSLDDFLQSAQRIIAERSEMSEHETDYVEQLTPSTWDQWTKGQRIQHLQDVVGPLGGYGMFGENLRELRSQRIEAWLVEGSNKA